MINRRGAFAGLFAALLIPFKAKAKQGGSTIDEMVVKLRFARKDEPLQTHLDKDGNFYAVNSGAVTGGVDLKIPENAKQGRFVWVPVLLAILLLNPTISKADECAGNPAYREKQWHMGGCVNADQLNQSLADGTLQDFYDKAKQPTPGKNRLTRPCNTVNFYDGKFHPGCISVSDLKNAGVRVEE